MKKECKDNFRRDNKAIALLAGCILFSIAVVLGFLIARGGATSLGLVILIFLALVFTAIVFRRGIEKTKSYILLPIIITIPFPILLRFRGSDAMTVTTVLIYSLFAVMAFDYLINKERPSLEPKFSFILPALIVFGMTISFVCNLNFLGQSLRYYVANMSGILLYFIVIFSLKKRSDLVLVIKIIVFLIMIQAAIAFSQLKFPEVYKYLQIFGTRDYSPQLELVGGIRRVKGTVRDFELLAEWFLIGSILSIGLIYELRKKFYIIPLFCCLGGIVFTNTRSDLFLFILGLGAVFFLLNLFKKDYRGTLPKIILGLILFGAIFSVFFDHQIANFFARFQKYFGSSNLLSSEAINRQPIWEMALKVYFKNPTIFGAGLYRVNSLYPWASSFHSLYLTLLYKFGVFGFIIHVLFWWGILQLSWRSLMAKKKPESWYILFFLFIAFILLLIDQMKVEYLRHQHTIQFAWLIYALLVAQFRQVRGSDENSVVSLTSV
ncbi:MAG: O-antigen ligase family protein [Candidatus Omnitrophica bacterium]|nr:O-antigen ligase family protein [Candidatus Omnitrophota bacterium]